MWNKLCRAFLMSVIEVLAGWASGKINVRFANV